MLKDCSRVLHCHSEVFLQNVMAAGSQSHVNNFANMTCYFEMCFDCVSCNAWMWTLNFHMLC